MGIKMCVLLGESELCVISLGFAGWRARSHVI
jgi:hypothetical protein